VQVDEVTRDVQGGDLAPAVPQQLIAGGEAFEQKSALGWTIPLAHQVLIHADLFDPCHCAFENLLLLVREDVAPFQFAEQATITGTILPPVWAPVPYSLSGTGSIDVVRPARH
jgi:hypothetical protein